MAWWASRRGWCGCWSGTEYRAARPVAAAGGARQPPGPVAAVDVGGTYTVWIYFKGKDIGFCSWIALRKKTGVQDDYGLGSE